MNPILLAGLVSVAGGLGALLRFLIDQSIPEEARARYPWGTSVINLSGSFILGLLVGPLQPFVWAPIVTVGLLGGYTTFSTASLETVELIEEGRWGRGMFYAAGTLVFCVGLALLGMRITS